MAKTPKVALAKAGENPGRIIDIDVASEMSESFLEYAYSVIYFKKFLRKPGVNTSSLGIDIRIVLLLSVSLSE